MSNKLYRVTDNGWSNEHRKLTALGILAGLMFVVGMVIGTTTACY